MKKSYRHTVLHCFSFLGISFKCIADKSAKHIENCRRFFDPKILDRIIEHVVTDERHECARNTVPGAIACSDKIVVVILFVAPVKISAHNGFRFKEKKMFE